MTICDCGAQAERLEEAVKKGQKKLSLAMKGFDSLEADHEEVGGALDQAATALKGLQQALKKAKTHVGQTKGHVQGGVDALAEGMA